MALQESIHRVEIGDFPNLVEVWEASIRASHRSVSDAYIRFFKPLARDELLHLVELACVRNEEGTAVGFIGAADGKIEALFVHPAWRGRGLGRRLVEHAVRSLGARGVDVDAQNEPLVSFYRHMGFEIAAQSAFHALGKPLPVLHMRR